MRKVNNFLRLLLLVLALLMVVVIVGIGLLFLKTQSNPPSVNNKELYLSDTIATLLQSAQEKQNEGVPPEDILATVEAHLAEIDVQALAPVDQAWIALEWARVHEPIDRDMALLEYARIYNEPSYESFMPVRNSALASAMLYATEVGSPKLSFIDAKRFIFAPDLFGHVVGIDTQQALDALKSDEDLRLLASIGLNLSSGGMLSSAREYRLQVESLLLKSEHLLYQLYEKDTSIDFIPIVAQQRLGQDSSIQKQFEEIFAQANSILTDLPANIARRNAYVSDILYTLNYLQRLYTQFVFIGYDALPPLDTSRQLLNSYVITHQDDHSFAAQRSNVILASSNYRYACALVIRDELDGQEQSVDSRIIRSLLDDIRQLSETDIEAGKSLLADAAKRPYLPCSYASVVIGTVYDPSFADFLVDEVGTWSRDQFMTPNDGASI